MLRCYSRSDPTYSHSSYCSYFRCYVHSLYSHLSYPASCWYFHCYLLSYSRFFHFTVTPKSSTLGFAKSLYCSDTSSYFLLRPCVGQAIILDARLSSLIFLSHQQSFYFGLLADSKHRATAIFTFGTLKLVLSVWLPNLIFQKYFNVLSYKSA